MGGRSHLIFLVTEDYTQNQSDSLAFNSFVYLVTMIDSY